MKRYWVNGTDLIAQGENEEDAIKNHKEYVCGNRCYEQYCERLGIDSDIQLEEIHSPDHLSELFEGYAECAMWTEEQDKLDFMDFMAMKMDCERFLVRLKALMERLELSIDELDMLQTGHDFWLTRNGHGSGFWDRDHSETLSDELCDLSKSFGGYTLCI